MTNYINRQMEKRNTDETEKEQINIERWFQVEKKSQNVSPVGIYICPPLLDFHPIVLQYLKLILYLC